MALCTVASPNGQIVAAKIAKVLVTSGYGDTEYRNEAGDSCLHPAIEYLNFPVLDTLLRAGCETNVFNQNGVSPLSLALFRSHQEQLFEKHRRLGQQMVELLLAFGVDLQQELYLFEDHELPEEYRGPEYANRRQTGEIDPQWLEALRQLRRSNEMLSLKRQCRNFIRQQLKPNADKIIDQLPDTSLPRELIKYLKLEEELRLFRNLH